MKRTKRWLTSKRLLMAQAEDLHRQLTEAWFDVADMREARDAARAVSLEMAETKHYLTEQLHRVARERDRERKLRIDAENALLDYYLDERKDDELARAADEIVDKYLENAANEEE